MSYELHIAHDFGVDHMLFTYNKIVDKEIDLFNERSLKQFPMVIYTHFVIRVLSCMILFCMILNDARKILNLNLVFVLNLKNWIWYQVLFAYGILVDDVL